MDDLSEILVKLKDHSMDNNPESYNLSLIVNTLVNVESLFKEVVNELPKYIKRVTESERVINHLIDKVNYEDLKFIRKRLLNENRDEFLGLSFLLDKKEYSFRFSIFKHKLSVFRLEMVPNPKLVLNVGLIKTIRGQLIKVSKELYDYNLSLKENASNFFYQAANYRIETMKIKEEEEKQLAEISKVEKFLLFPFTNTYKMILKHKLKTNENNYKEIYGFYEKYYDHYNKSIERLEKISLMIDFLDTFEEFLTYELVVLFKKLLKVEYIGVERVDEVYIFQLSEVQSLIRSLKDDFTSINLEREREQVEKKFSLIK